MQLSIYRSVLEKLGFHETRQYEYAIEYAHNDGDVVYLSKTRNESALVIHPNNYNRIESLGSLLGVSFLPQKEVFVHNTAFARFPRRITSRGSTPIHHGLEFSIDNEIAVYQFLQQLLGISDPQTDIDAAKTELDSVTDTERDALVKSRKGQGLWRKELDELWGQCALTGCGIRSLLRGSHIKPWRVANNQERLDRYNGLLLRTDIDSLFDVGLVTFENNGSLVFASELGPDQIEQIPFTNSERISKLTAQHVKYLNYHRDCVFRG